MGDDGSSKHTLCKTPVKFYEDPYIDMPFFVYIIAGI